MQTIKIWTTMLYLEKKCIFKRLRYIRGYNYKNNLLLTLKSMLLKLLLWLFIMLVKKVFERFRDISGYTIYYSMDTSFYSLHLTFQIFKLLFFFKIFFWCAPFAYLYFLIFLYWARIGCRNRSWHGFDTTSI